MQNKNLKMSVKTNSSSDLSLDSLEVDQKDKNRKEIYSTNGGTILVPFYEKDVLVKIDKPQMKLFNRKQNKTDDNKDARKPEMETKSYLVNRNTNKPRKPSYLEAFRRKFTLEFIQDNKNVEEIRSISPEFGDTERDSISDEETSPNHDFYETEAYNDIYYEKIMNQEVADAFNNNFEQVKLTEGNPFNEYIIDNLRSISELTQPRRRSRRASVEPVPNVRLGGLGPDLENIKPRLERAKSLQRYSEKVRMENKLKIYKKLVQDTSKSKKDSTGSQKIDLSEKKLQKENEPTYLVNKCLPARKVIQNKSKSANARNGRTDHDSKRDGDSNETYQVIKDRKSFIKKDLVVRGASAQKHIKTTFKEAKKKDKEKNSSDTKGNEISERITKTPNFDALKSLEEKHRMYQERVKQFQIVGTRDY